MPPTKRRNPAIAFVLSIVLPGLGHMYNGELAKGVAAYVGLWLVMATLVLAGVMSGAHGTVALALVVATYPVVVAAHSAVRAARLKECVLKWYNKWPYYLAVTLLAFLVLTPAIVSVGQRRMAGTNTLGQHFMAGASTLRMHNITGFRTFKMPATSMEPALIRGDYFIAKLTRNGCPTPVRGEVVVFPYPEDQSMLFVKRIIGLPGERIQIKDKVVFIDKAPLNDPWSQHYDSRIVPATGGPRDNFGPMTIPRDAVFVMGDNRDFSHDSRFWGSVQIKEIEGKAWFIYWSDDVKRIGKRVE